jgi:hypothetical protein
MKVQGDGQDTLLPTPEVLKRHNDGLPLLPLSPGNREAPDPIATAENAARDPGTLAVAETQQSTDLCGCQCCPPSGQCRIRPVA